MRKTIKIYYLTQKTEIDPEVFEDSDLVQDGPFRNDPKNYFPVVEETIELHQLNLEYTPQIAEKHIPFTVFYYSVNSLVMSDSPFWLKGMFEFRVRAYEYMSYAF